MHDQRSLAAAAVLVLLAGCSGGQQAAAPADDATISSRVVDYFKKSVTTPGLEFKVTKIEPAELPGWKKGNAQVSLGQQTQDVSFYVSQDGHYMLRGELVDLTVDPTKQVMSKIKLDGKPSRGPKDAKVTIVEYSDFQCPFCGRVYGTLENQVLKEYGDKVRFVFKNFPLANIHPWAEDAALATECAFRQGNDQFWALYGALFSQQAEITKENLRDKIMAAAEGNAIDAAKLKECIDGRQTADALKADRDEATALGVNSTPTFFINGRRLAGAQTLESFKQMIDQELGSSG